MNPLQAVYDWYRQVLRNPKYRWWVILGTVAYLVSPFDIAPDFIPIVGQIDDVLLMTLLVSEVSQLLIERVKTRSNSQTGSDAAASVTTNTTTNTTMDEQPVDVKAVDVKAINVE